MSRNSGSRDLLTTSALSGLCALGVWAAIAGAASAAPAAADADAGAAPAAGSGGATVQEVIVTATRREESVQNVPISVTALTPRQISADRIQTFADVFTKVTGANFVPIKGSSQSTPNIRGQASSNESPALDVPVGMFIDDVYYGGPASYSSDFFDVAQIAVLKGPQGTTFGRNVVGGAIQITSQKPAFGDDGGAVGVTVGNYNDFETRGFVNRQFSDQLAGRLAFSVKNRGGYDHNVVTNTDINDEKVWSLRGSLRYKPTDDLDINAVVGYTHQDNYGDGPKFIGPGSLTASQSQDPHTVYLDENGINRRNIFSSVVNIGWTTPYGLVSSITGYHTLDGLWRDDVDARPTAIFWPSNNANKEASLSQEFRLVSPSGKTFEYVVGLYGSLDQYRKDLTLTADGCDVTLQFNSINTAGGNPCFRPASLNQGVHVSTIAPYGEVKWNITDQFALTVGGRYTYITKKGFTNHVNSSFSYGAAYSAKFDASFDAFTPRVALQWKPLPHSMLFASVAQGFKSGGFSESATSQLRAETPLRPEKSTSYEIGMKNEFFDRRLTFNLTFYDALTKDLQTKSLVGTLFVETNAGEAEVKGLELEVSVRPITGLQIGANYALTDARYKSFPNCTAGGVSCSGNQIPNTPKNDLLFYGQYNLGLGNGSSLEFRGDVKFTDPFYSEPTNKQVLFARPLTKIKGLVNGSVIYHPANASWDLQLWGKNLTNENYVVFSNNYYFFAATKVDFAAGVTDVDRSIFAPPRTYGVTLNYRF